MVHLAVAFVQSWEGIGDRNDDGGGRYTSPSLLCGCRNMGKWRGQRGWVATHHCCVHVVMEMCEGGQKQHQWWVVQIVVMFVQSQEGVGAEMMAEVGGTLCCHFRVAAGAKEGGEDSKGGCNPSPLCLCGCSNVWEGAEVMAMVGGTHCCHVCVVTGRRRGRNDSRGGRYTLPSLSCGHRNKGRRGQQGWV